MLSWRTNDEMFVCLKYCLANGQREFWNTYRDTYERTLEKSAEGDITKLSALGDHDIKC